MSFRDAKVWIVFDLCKLLLKKLFKDSTLTLSDVFLNRYMNTNSVCFNRIDYLNSANMESNFFSVVLNSEIIILISLRQNKYSVCCFYIRNSNFFSVCENPLNIVIQLLFVFVNRCIKTNSVLSFFLKKVTTKENFSIFFRNFQKFFRDYLT